MKTKNVRFFAALTVGGLLALGTFAQAQEADKPAKPPGDRQGPPGGSRRADMGQRLDKMAEELGLSAEQKTQLEAAMKERMEKAQVLRGGESLSPEDRRAKMREIADAHLAKVKSILTPEQFTKWEEMRPARGQRPGGPGGPGGFRGPRDEGKPTDDKPADKTE